MPLLNRIPNPCNADAGDLDLGLDAFRDLRPQKARLEERKPQVPRAAVSVLGWNGLVGCWESHRRDEVWGWGLGRVGSKVQRVKTRRVTKTMSAQMEMVDCALETMRLLELAVGLITPFSDFIEMEEDGDEEWFFLFSPLMEES